MSTGEVSGFRTPETGLTGQKGRLVTDLEPLSGSFGGRHRPPGAVRRGTAVLAAAAALAAPEVAWTSFATALSADLAGRNPA